MNRFMLIVSWILLGVGSLALLVGILTLNLMPAVLGALLVGIAGILYYLVHLYLSLGEAVPKLSSLAKTAEFLALKEPRASRRAAGAAELESGERVREHPDRVVDADARGGHLTGSGA